MNCRNNDRLSSRKNITANFSVYLIQILTFQLFENFDIISASCDNFTGFIRTGISLP